MLKINISPTYEQYAVVIEVVASRSDIELERTRSAFQLSSQPWCCIILVGSSISFFSLPNIVDSFGRRARRGRELRKSEQLGQSRESQIKADTKSVLIRRHGQRRMMTFYAIYCGNA